MSAAVAVSVQVQETKPKTIGNVIECYLLFATPVSLQCVHELA
jgi:hypothetical protein